jgi:hypothetical protein
VQKHDTAVVIDADQLHVLGDFECTLSDVLGSLRRDPTHPFLINLADDDIEQINTGLDITLELLQTLRISPEATKNIAQGAFEVAKYVELIGINYYRGIVLLHAQKKLAYSLAHS